METLVRSLTALKSYLEGQFSAAWKKLQTPQAASNCQDKLRCVLRKSAIIPGKSLDYFDLFSDAVQAELNVIYKAELKAQLSLNSTEKYCPICFDSFQGEECILAGCGHRACTSCWRALIRSAASSGDAIIRCPSYKCSNMIGIYDVAHILFSAHDYDDPRKCLDIDRLANLMRFRIENHMLNNGASFVKSSSNVRFCPTPSCNRVFLPTNASFVESAHEGLAIKLSLHGSDIHVCDCGWSMCGQCGQSSHFGRSYQR